MPLRIQECECPSGAVYGVFSMGQHEIGRGDWVTYNPRTATYDTPDGTSVPAELVDNVQCLSDVLRIAQIRAKQRAERPNK